MTTNTELLIGLGDPANDVVWTDFSNRYFPVLIAFGRRLGLSEHDAQDAAQDALLAFADSYRKGRYDRNKGRLRTWLYGIASNKIRDVQRRRPRERVVADATDETGLINRIPDDQTMSDLWETEWQRAVFQVCIQEVRKQVKPSSMQVFELCILKQWPTNKAAEHLKMSEAAVLKARTRVLSRMRDVRDRLEREW